MEMYPIVFKQGRRAVIHMELREAVEIYKKNGGHFFDKDTMRFFGSKVESELFDNRCFITSEDNFNETERFFTVRRFSENYTRTETMGEFNKIANYDEAVKIAISYMDK